MTRVLDQVVFTYLHFYFLVVRDPVSEKLLFSRCTTYHAAFYRNDDALLECGKGSVH